MKQNIIIVDNFYENPYEVRQYALNLEYPQPENHTYQVETQKELSTIKKFTISLRI